MGSLDGPYPSGSLECHHDNSTAVTRTPQPPLGQQPQAHTPNSRMPSFSQVRTVHGAFLSLCLPLACRVWRQRRATRAARPRSWTPAPPFAQGSVCVGRQALTGTTHGTTEGTETRPANQGALYRRTRANNSRKPGPLSSLRPRVIIVRFSVRRFGPPLGKLTCWRFSEEQVFKSVSPVPRDRRTFKRISGIETSPKERTLGESSYKINLDSYMSGGFNFYIDFATRITDLARKGKRVTFTSLIRHWRRSRRTGHVA